MSWRAITVLVVIGGGLYAFAAWGERRANTPEALERAAGAACAAMFDNHRLSLGDEGKDDAQDALRYATSRLDEATDPDVVAIDEYLDHDRRESRILAATGDLKMTDPFTGHDLFVRAVRACTNLGHPELQRYLYDETGNEDYA